MASPKNSLPSKFYSRGSIVPYLTFRNLTMKPYLQLTWEHEKVHCFSSSSNFSLASISRCFWFHPLSSRVFMTLRKINSPLPPDCKTDLQTLHHSFSSCYPLSFSLLCFDYYFLWKCLIICFPKFRPMLLSLFFQFLPKSFFWGLI